MEYKTLASKPDTSPAIDSKTLDLGSLRKLSLEHGGFGDARTSIWPRLLHAETTKPQVTRSEKEGLNPSNDDTVKSSQLETHPDERQVRLDTDRSFVLYPVVDNDIAREKSQNELYELIVSVFRKRRRLNYFQGYHDVVSVLFLTLPKELQLPCVEKLSLHRIRDSMGTSLEPVLGLLRVLRKILSLANPSMNSILESVSPLPYFALSNILTLFSHDVPTLPLIQHVFDYLLCRPPISVVYLAAAFILSREHEAERLAEEGEEGMIHSLLNNLPDLFEGEDMNEAPAETTTTEDQDTQSSDVAATDSLDKVNSPLGLTESRNTDSHVSCNDDTPISQTLDVSDNSASPEEPSLSKTTPAQNSETEKVEISEEEKATTDTPNNDSSSQLNVEDSTHSSASSTIFEFRRSRVSLSSLLKRADELFEAFPPTHPDVALSTIMGPQSVMFTWSEDPTQLPDDDEAELMVTQLQLIVLPAPEQEVKEKESDYQTPRRRRHHHHRLPKRIGPVVVERRAVVASAVLVLGVAMAAYGLTAQEQSHHHGATQELKRVSRLVGGVALAAGERLVEAFWTP